MEKNKLPVVIKMGKTTKIIECEKWDICLTSKEKKRNFNCVKDNKTNTFRVED